MKPTFLVTGATSGLGLELVKKLADRQPGSRIILGVRNVDEARRQVEALDAALPGLDVTSRVHVGPSLDLGDFDSVRAFARAINDSPDPLHVLVNNAGMNKNSTQRKDAKWPEIISVNYLGPFLLTLLLEPKLLRHADSADLKSRVVNVSSIMSRFSTLAEGVSRLEAGSNNTVIDAFMRPEGHQQGVDEVVSTSRLYSDTKLGNALFTEWLNNRWKDRSQSGNLRAMSVDPGGVVTGIWRNSRWENSKLLGMFFAPAADGAEALYDCCIDPLSEPATPANFYARGAFKSPLLQNKPESKRLAVAAGLVAAFDWPIRNLSGGRLASTTGAVVANLACYDPDVVSRLGDATEEFLSEFLSESES